MKKNDFKEFHASSISLSLSSPGPLFDLSNSFTEYTTVTTVPFESMYREDPRDFILIHHNHLYTATVGFVHIGPVNNIHDFCNLTTYSLFPLFFALNMFYCDICIQKSVHYIHEIFKELWENEGLWVHQQDRKSNITSSSVPPWLHSHTCTHSHPILDLVIIPLFLYVLLPHFYLCGLM